MAGLTRGIVVGICLDEEWKHTMRLEGSTWYLQDESLEIFRQTCNKANEETYPSPLLVNIKLI